MLQDVLNSYIKTATLSTILSHYVKTDSAQDLLSDYYTKEETSNKIKELTDTGLDEYAKKALNDYYTKTQVDSKIGAATDTIQSTKWNDKNSELESDFILGTLEESSLHMIPEPGKIYIIDLSEAAAGGAEFNIGIDLPTKKMSINSIESKIVFVANTSSANAVLKYSLDSGYHILNNANLSDTVPAASSLTITINTYTKYIKIEKWIITEQEGQKNVAQQLLKGVGNSNIRLLCSSEPTVKSNYSNPYKSGNIMAPTVSQSESGQGWYIDIVPTDDSDIMQMSMGINTDFINKILDTTNSNKVVGVAFGSTIINNFTTEVSSNIGIISTNNSLESLKYIYFNGNITISEMYGLIKDDSTPIKVGTLKQLTLLFPTNLKTAIESGNNNIICNYTIEYL